MMRRRSCCAALLCATTRPVGAETVLSVGPKREIRSLAEAARRARDGDTVEVDAGEYRQDVAVWLQDRLTIRTRGGRVRLLADGAAAEGKAIWVVRGGRVSVEGFDFEGARVESRNGAGIRFETGRLTVRDCRFLGNEMGLLTNNDRDAELVVENSEFAHNRRPDGHNHNLYAGSIAKLAVRGSCFHHATVGHLLKSRAAVNHIFYNELADGVDGSASYELEFPNGGIAVVVGNVIQQSAMTENPIMISYGAEGYVWPVNSLALVHNTLVDQLPKGGISLRAMPGSVAVKAWNNLLLGKGSMLDDAAPGDYRHNVSAPWSAVSDVAQADYRLRPGALADALVEDPGSFAGLALRPTHEFARPRGTQALALAPKRPGALQNSGHPQQ